MTGTFVYF